MLKRILTAAVLILVLVGTFAAGLLVSPYFIDAVVWLCSLVALHEMHGALKKAGYDPIVPGLVVAGVTTRSYPGLSSRVSRQCRSPRGWARRVR